MTYGRPTMTAHLPNVPLPSGMDFDEYPIVPESDTAPESKPSRLSFFIQFIRQCGMLGEILSNVYQPSTGVAANGLASASSSWGQHIKNHGMDAILELDAKLLRFESSLPPIMSWKTPCEIDGFGEDQKPIIVAQRTVLHGRYDAILLVSQWLQRRFANLAGHRQLSPPKIDAASPNPDSTVRCRVQRRRLPERRCCFHHPQSGALQLLCGRVRKDLPWGRNGPHRARS